MAYSKFRLVNGLFQSAKFNVKHFLEFSLFSFQVSVLYFLY